MNLNVFRGVVSFSASDVRRLAVIALVLAFGFGLGALVGCVDKKSPPVQQKPKGQPVAEVFKDNKPDEVIEIKVDLYYQEKPLSILVEYVPQNMWSHYTPSQQPDHWNAAKGDCWVRPAEGKNQVLLQLMGLVPGEYSSEWLGTIIKEGDHYRLTNWKLAKALTLEENEKGPNGLPFRPLPEGDFGEIKGKVDK